MQRRSMLGAGAATAVLGLAGCAELAMNKVPLTARVLVVGGGFGGATAAKYIRLFSGQRIQVVLVEPGDAFVSCPLSNLVLGGTRMLGELTVPYRGLSGTHGVQVVRDRVVSVDLAGKRATLGSGAQIGYDKLVLSPGVDLMFDQIEGLQAAHIDGSILQAWKAGDETLALRRQLESMRDGGVYAIVVPEAPYRCPPGPYERACQVASYFKASKPRSKVLVLDANPDVTSKGALFKRVWAEEYGGMVEYRPQHRAVGVDGRSRTVRFDVQSDVRADVLNVLPPMRAGRLAVDAGLANANARWVRVDYLNFQSTAARDVHVIGDAIQIAPGMPKSGHMANAQAKVLAAAIVSELSGEAPDPAPLLTNTCYSFIDAKRVVHVASVHTYDTAEKTYKPVPGAGGLSTGPTELEGHYAWSWAHSIWSDALV